MRSRVQICTPTAPLMVIIELLCLGARLYRTSYNNLMIGGRDIRNKIFVSVPETGIITRQAGYRADVGSQCGSNQ